MKLTCDSYADGAVVPLPCVHRSVRGGQNRSPAFSWSDPPLNTKSFALTIIDPHPVANNWIHWMVINMPFRFRSLPEGASRGSGLPAGAREMRNSFGELGYGGPAPPKGSGSHPYVATLYALNVESLDLPGDATLRQFERAIEGKVAAEEKSTGYFGRP